MRNIHTQNSLIIIHIVMMELMCGVLYGEGRSLAAAPRAQPENDGLHKTILEWCPSC